MWYYIRTTVGFVVKHSSNGEVYNVYEEPEDARRACSKLNARESNNPNPWYVKETEDYFGYEVVRDLVTPFEVEDSDGKRLITCEVYELFWDEEEAVTLANDLNEEK